MHVNLHLKRQASLPPPLSSQRFPLSKRSKWKASRAGYQRGPGRVLWGAQTEEWRWFWDRIPKAQWSGQPFDPRPTEAGGPSPWKQGVHHHGSPEKRRCPCWLSHRDDILLSKLHAEQASLWVTSFQLSLQPAECYIPKRSSGTIISMFQLKYKGSGGAIACRASHREDAAAHISSTHLVPLIFVSVFRDPSTSQHRRTFRRKSFAFGMAKTWWIVAEDGDGGCCCWWLKATKKITKTTVTNVMDVILGNNPAAAVDATGLKR